MRSHLGLLCSGLLVTVGGCMLVDGTGTTTSTGSTGSKGDTTSSGMGGSTSDDPCMGVPTEGQCVGTTKIQSCFVSEEGNTPPRIIESTCGAQQACQVVNGSAVCKPTGACFNGATACKDSATMQECQNGAW